MNDELREAIRRAEALLSSEPPPTGAQRSEARELFTAILDRPPEGDDPSDARKFRLRALLGLVEQELLDPASTVDASRAQELRAAGEIGTTRDRELALRARWVAGLALAEYHPSGAPASDTSPGEEPAEQAIAALRDALDSEFRAHDYPLHRRALENLRAVAQQSFDPATARRCTEKLLVLAREARDDPSALRCALELAREDIARSDCEEAGEQLSSALVHARAMGPETEAEVLGQAAELRAACDDLRGAAVDLRSALELREKLGHSLEFLRTSIALGDTHVRAEEFSEAHEIFDHGRAMAVLLDHPVEELVLIRRLLDLAEQRRDPPAARRLAEEAARKLDQLPPGTELERGYTHWVLARHFRRSNIEAAYFSHLSAALDVAERAGDMPLAYLAASKLGEPHPVELVRRMQKPPIDGHDLLSRAEGLRVFPGDPELRLGFLLAARDLLRREPGARTDAGRELLGRIKRDILKLRSPDAPLDLEGTGFGSSGSDSAGERGDGP